MPEYEVYQDLIEWLRKAWWNLPESDELMPMIMATCSPEEASLLTGLPFESTSLEAIADKKDVAPEILKLKLDNMATKGLVFRTVKGNRSRYKLNDSFFIFFRSAFWSGATDERTKNIAAHVNPYFYDGFYDQYELTHLKGLRVLPAEDTMEDINQILPYEEVVKVLDSASYYAVSVCPCRHRKNIDPDFADCQYTLKDGSIEVCLHFDRLGKYTVENGMGREITRQEAREILRQCAEAGLVHGISNQQKGPDTICNCCRDCCIWFEAFYKLKHSMSLSPSSYLVSTNDDTCKGCGLCVKRCPMGALRLEDSTETKNKTGKITVLDPALCIGCGVCAYKCPTKSLVLHKRVEYETPPTSGQEYGMKIMADFASGAGKK